MKGFAGGVARAGANAAVALGLGLRGAHVGAGGADRSYAARQDFDGNVLTSDPEHFAWFGAQAEARPDLTLGAPTFGWLASAFRELEALRSAPAPELPALLLLGRMVRNKQSIYFLIQKKAMKLKTRLILCMGYLSNQQKPGLDLKRRQSHSI